MIANQGKNEIIGSLLALRAGLSVVSQENDAIKRTTGLAESAIQKKKAEKNALSLSNIAAKKHVESVSARLKRSAEDYDQSKNVSSSAGILKGVFAIIIALAVCAGAVAAAYFGIDFFFKELYSEGEPSVMSWVLCIVFTVLLGLACLAVFIASVIFCGGTAVMSFSEAGTLIGNKRKIKNEYSMAKSAAPGEYEMSKKNIASNNARIAAIDREIAALQNQCKADCLPHVIAGVTVYGILQRTYGSVIAESDWPVIDYVIYLFATGRADTLKEALLTADTERRKDEIISAIHQAADKISDTVKQSAQMIGGILSAGINTLASAIQSGINRQSALIAEQNAKLGSLSSQVSSLSGSVAAFGNSISVSAALNAKLNESSEQLMSDVKQLRIYADNEAVLRRNRT